MAADIISGVGLSHQNNKIRKEDSKMQGWRARIGLIIGSANYNMEPDFYKMAPEGITVHTSRILVTESTAESIVEMEKHAVRAAEELKTAAVDILVYGCTAGSFLKGLGQDTEVIKALEDASSIPTITTSTAVVEALRLLEINKVSVATPYTDDINAKLKTFLEDNGFIVVQLKGLLDLMERKKIYPLSDIEISCIGIQEPYVSYKLVRKMATDDSHGFFISCTNLRAVEIIQMLENDLGKPVISSNQASLAIALKRLGIRSNVKGFGSLFER